MIITLLQRISNALQAYEKLDVLSNSLEAFSGNGLY